MPIQRQRQGCVSRTIHMSRTCGLACPSRLHVGLSPSPLASSKRANMPLYRQPGQNATGHWSVVAPHFSKRNDRWNSQFRFA